MKAHDKIDFTIDEDLGYYSKYEPEWASIWFFGAKEGLKEVINIYENSKEDYTSSRALNYHLAQCHDFYPDVNFMSKWFLFDGTPIERLYFHCFRYICNIEKLDLHLIPQYRIEIGDQRYYVDFLIHGELLDESKDGKYVVECDGYDYHSSKKQQAYDNQRQRDIENAGYTVIRFSGKEIFDDEVKCVYETLKRLDIEVKE